jgi:epoxide hydrolase
MNAEVRRTSTAIEPCRLAVPEAALRRLRLRLSHGQADREAWDASLAYGASADAVGRLAQYWLDDFELDVQPLFALPSFTARVADSTQCFVHVRSDEADAIPLLLLHGYWGSPAEFDAMIEPLVNPRASSGSKADGFHVVCPFLPGFGLSDGVPSPAAVAEVCAALMQQLGYTRYAVHGSDLGATTALALAALDSERVAALHISALPAYPEDAGRVAALTSQEKSRLALLTELYHELSFQLPESPIEELAFALARLEDAEQPEHAPWCDALLTSLTLSWTLGDVRRRSELYQTSRLAAARPTRAPLAMHAFPLDAPCLRRFAERQHRIVEWEEHEWGGPMPALEQPELLITSLHRFCENVR